MDVWIRDSDLVSIHGYGGNAAAYENHTNFSDPRIWGHPSGGPSYMPSLFRVTNSTRVLLANLVDSPRFPGPSNLMSAGFGVDPARWNMVLRDDSVGPAEGCAPYPHTNLSRATTGDACSTTAVYDRPVLWQWEGDPAAHRRGPGTLASGDERAAAGGACPTAPSYTPGSLGRFDRKANCSLSLPTYASGACPGAGCQNFEGFWTVRQLMRQKFPDCSVGGHVTLPRAWQRTGLGSVLLRDGCTVAAWQSGAA